MKTKRLGNKTTAEQKLLIQRAVFSLLGVVLFISVGIFLANKFLNKDQQTQNEELNRENTAAALASISYNGQEYRTNASLSTLLLMGIDQNFDDESTSNSARNGGQADFLALIIIDSSNQTVTRLQIDRDTMTEITILGVLGNEAGTRNLQICLSHGYGDGREQSCELTRKAVEQLLYGIHIDDYLAVSLGGIGALNDALGGVSVLIEDDFSYYSATMIPGTEIKLTAEQAEYYVRRRANIDEETNESRMRRQSVFMRRSIEIATQRLKSDLNYADSLFDTMEPYMTTDMSRGKIINMINTLLDYRLIMEPLAIQGEYGIGTDHFIEFHVDADALHQLVIDTFYEPVL